jgi:hypothetical protein
MLTFQAKLLVEPRLGSKAERLVAEVKVKNYGRVTSVSIRAVAFFVLSNTLSLQQAQAASSYEARAEATIEVSGSFVDAGVINILDFLSFRGGDDNGPDLPNSVNRDSTAEGDTLTRRARVQATNSGFAFHTGEGSLTKVESQSWAAGEFGVVNLTDFGFFVDLTVRGYFGFRGSVQDGNRENASAWYRLRFIGDSLEGYPEDGRILSHRRDVRPPLMPAPGPHGFDLATSTFVSGVPETYSVLVPPSLEVVNAGRIDIHIYTVGLQVWAGGEAASAFVTDFVVLPLRSLVPHIVIRPRVISCFPKRPIKKRSASIRETSDGLYELKIEDPIDPNPKALIFDAAGTGPFGPYRSGDLVEITVGEKEKDEENHRQDAHTKLGRAPVAHILLKGAPIVTAMTDLTALRETAVCKEEAAGPRQRRFLAPMATPKIEPKGIKP